MGRGVTRRDVLSGLGVGVVGSLAGCHEAAVPDDESVAGDWPTFGYDAANTGVSPDSPGPSDPAERWRFTLDREATASPAVVGDTVYVDTLGGHTYALGAATGERRWLARASFPLFGTPAVDDGTVYVTDGGGYLHALAEGGWAGDPEGTARPAGEFLWQVRGHAGFTASPTVAGGSVYLGTYEGDLHAFDAADGTERWRTDVGHGITGAPAVAAGTVYLGTLGHELRAVAVADGTTRWTVPTGGSVPASPAVAGESVYVATEGGEVLAFGA